MFVLYRRWDDVETGMYCVVNVVVCYCVVWRQRKDRRDGCVCHCVVLCCDVTRHGYAKGVYIETERQREG